MVQVHRTSLSIAINYVSHYVNIVILCIISSTPVEVLKTSSHSPCLSSKGIIIPIRYFSLCLSHSFFLLQLYIQKKHHLDKHISFAVMSSTHLWQHIKKLRRAIVDQTGPVFCITQYLTRCPWNATQDSRPHLLLPFQQWAFRDIQPMKPAIHSL